MLSCCMFYVVRHVCVACSDRLLPARTSAVRLPELRLVGRLLPGAARPDSVPCLRSEYAALPWRRKCSQPKLMPVQGRCAFSHSFESRVCDPASSLAYGAALMCRLLHHPRPGRRGAQLEALQNKAFSLSIGPTAAAALGHGGTHRHLGGQVLSCEFCPANTRLCKAKSSSSVRADCLCKPGTLSIRCSDVLALRPSLLPSGFEPAGFFQPGGKAGEVRTLHCARLFACLLLAGCTLLFFLRRSAKSVRRHRPLNPLGFTSWSLLRSAQLPADVQVLRGRLVPEN
jgi:hypothetical protein